MKSILNQNHSTVKNCLFFFILFILYLLLLTLYLNFYPKASSLSFIMCFYIFFFIFYFPGFSLRECFYAMEDALWSFFVLLLITPAFMWLNCVTHDKVQLTAQQSAVHLCAFLQSHVLFPAYSRHLTGGHFTDRPLYGLSIL